jgi:hypothetical protein
VRLIDGNEDRQKRCAEEQDGSKSAPSNSRTPTAMGENLYERLQTYEQIRDLAAER